MGCDGIREQWAADAKVLASIGQVLRDLPRTLAVRLPAALAGQARSAWDRDDEVWTTSFETSIEARLRSRAADLALIGLAIESGGVADDDGTVEVRLDVTFIASALEAAAELDSPSR